MRVPRDFCHLTPDGDWARGRGPGGAVLIWPYTQHWGHPYRTRDPRRADPVNLFVLGASPARIAADLASAGWGRPDDGGTHRLWLDGRLRRMDGHVALGTRERRLHARLWEVPAGTILATHDEYLGNGNRHVVVSWDAARERLHEDLAAAGYGPLHPSGAVVACDLRGVPGDGRIWRLVAP